MTLTGCLMLEGMQHEPVAEPTNESVRALCRDLARGDRAALEQLYNDQFDRLFRFARASTRRDENFCLDVVQDTFLRIIRRLPALDSPAALDAYLRRAVLSAARDRLRKESRRSSRERSHASASRTSDTPRESEPAHAASLAHIESEIKSLDAESQFIFESRARFGWTLARIGEALDLKPGAVDGRFSRIVRRIRANVGEKIDE